MRKTLASLLLCSSLLTPACHNKSDRAPDRATRAAWQEAGALDMRERARRRALELLRASFPAVIAPVVDQAIRSEFNIRLPRQVMAAGGYP